VLTGCCSIILLCYMTMTDYVNILILSKRFTNSFMICLIPRTPKYALVQQ
jgi:hypothetical protein